MTEHTDNFTPKQQGRNGFLTKGKLLIWSAIALLGLKKLYWKLRKNRPEFYDRFGYENTRKLFHMGKSFHQKILAESDYHKRQGLYAEYYESVYTFLTPFNTRKSCGGMKIDLVIKYNAIFAGKRVLDFGCGLGDVSMELAKRAQQVYGLDASESAIEAAKKNAEGLENVEFFVNSDLGLPFEDESLDAVYSCDLLEHLHPEDAAIHVSEVCRILSKGGKYLFWTPGSRTGPHDCTQCFYPKGMGFKSKADHLKEYRNDEVEALLRKAGFARVEFPSSAIEVLALATKV